MGYNHFNYILNNHLSFKLFWFYPEFRGFLMSEEGIPQFEQLNPQLRDKIDWPYEVNYAILTIFSMKKDSEKYNAENLNEMIELLENHIPEVYRDKEYRDEIARQNKPVKVDRRPDFCGIKMDEGLYRQIYKQEPYDMEEQIKPAKKYGAIINLLHRLGALNKIENVEAAEDKMTEEEYLAANAEPKT